MAECCDICGNTGFAETIVTCSKCKINKEHLYCMRTFLKEAPEDWLCEECNPIKLENQPSDGKKVGFSEEPNPIIPCKDQHENLQCEYPRRKYRRARGFGWEKKVCRGRTCYVPVKVALGLPQDQSAAPTVKITTVKSPKKHISSPLSRTPVNPGAHSPKFQQPNKHPTSSGLQHLKNQSLENSKNHATSSGLQHLKPQSLENSKKHPSSSGLQHLKTPSLENSKKRATSSGLQHPKTLSLENSKINQVAQPKVLSGSDKTVQNPTKRHIEKQQPLKAFNPTPEVKMTEKCVDKKRNDIYSSPQSHYCKNIISGPMEKEQTVETDKTIGGTKITEGTTSKHTSASFPQIISGVDLQTSNENLITYPTNIKKCFSDPAAFPSWEGSFNIYDNLNFNGFKAHHPFRVCKKAREFAKLLPEILDFKLVRRKDLWAKLFHDDHPTREDVGLYFFPCDKDRSKEYKALLELIQVQDMMMIKQIDNVEILVFTSTVLEMDCQKMDDGEYFLWGLFHRIGKKDKVSNVEVVVDKEIDMISGKDQEEVDMEIDLTGGGGDDEVDMEIDMIGGQNVGKEDVVIPNGSRNKFGNSTPAPVTAGVTVPSISRVKVKKEPFEDFPPGFEPLMPPRKP